MHAVRRTPTEPDDLEGPDVSSLIRAAALLRGSGMPVDEIRAIVTTAEPELVHRYVELHLERLEEWVAAQRRTLASVEALLASGAPSAGRAAS
jgi:hypothetical protein